MWNHVEAWWTLAVLALFPVAVVAGIGYAIHEQAREDGWGKALWDASALVGIVVVVTLAALAIYALTT